MAGFYPSLLYYHYSDVVEAMGQFPMATVLYGLLLQCLFAVVETKQFSEVAIMGAFKLIGSIWEIDGFTQIIPTKVSKELFGKINIFF
jgi:hypothetical protein